MIYNLDFRVILKVFRGFHINIIRLKGSSVDSLGGGEVDVVGGFNL